MKVYLLKIQTKGDDCIIRLRRLLKIAWRVFAIKVIRIEEIVDNQANDP